MKLANNLLLKSVTDIHQILPLSHRWRALKVMVLTILNSLFELVGVTAIIPLFYIVLSPNVIVENNYLSRFYNWVGFASHQYFVLTCCGVFLLLFLSKTILGIRIYKYQVKFIYDIYLYFTTLIFRVEYYKGFLYFKDTTTPNIRRNILIMPQRLSQYILLPLISFFTELVVLSLIITSLFLYKPIVVTSLLLIVTPLFSILYLYIRKRIDGMGDKKDKLLVALDKNITEGILGYVDIMMTQVKESFFLKHSQASEEFNEANIRVITANYLPPKIIDVAIFFTIVAIVFFASLSGNGTSVIAMIGVFGLAAYRLVPSFNKILASLITIKEYQYILSWFKSNIVSLHNLSLDGNIERISSAFLLSDSIQLRNIDFRYSSDSALVLNGLNVSIKKGDCIGIIGSSGAGKSTLVSLLLGFLSPDKGDIHIDNHKLTSETLPNWRSMIGYVPQSVYLLDDSIIKNVAIGLLPEEIDVDRVHTVIQAVSLGELIASLPEGIYTQVGEQGGRLSGGQRQRLGIARALYRNPQILIFDEATSALDNQTEIEVTDAINELAQGELTIIMIAHRYTTLKYCNRILKMNKGTFSEETTYRGIINEIYPVDSTKS